MILPLTVSLTRNEDSGAARAIVVGASGLEERSWDNFKYQSVIIESTLGQSAEVIYGQGRFLVVEFGLESSQVGFD